MPKKLHPFDTEELAAHLCDLDYDEIDADTSIIEEALYNKYELSLEKFHDLVDKLIDMIDVGKSPVTDKVYKGFTKDGAWIVKKEID